MSKVLRANLVLLFVALIWGGTFPLIHNAVHQIPATSFVFFRFLIAACLFLPFIFMKLKLSSKQLILGGLVIGLLDGGVYLGQSIGLEHMSSARGAFLTGVSVIIVPFLLPLFKLGLPRKEDLLAACICCLGLFVFTGAKITGFSTSDLWVLFGAFCYAVAIVFVQWFTQKTSDGNKHPVLLTFYQILFTVPFAGMFAWHSNFHMVWSKEIISALLYCSVLATILVLYLQIRFQKDTTATSVALIFSLEPVFASVIAYAFNKEELSSAMILGGGLVLLGILIPELWRKTFKRKLKLA